jgi:hypothetical protein
MIRKMSLGIRDDRNTSIVEDRRNALTPKKLAAPEGPSFEVGKILDLNSQED